MFVPTPFGVMLKEKRESAKLSQGELAESLGKTAQYISNIEKGKNNSPPDDGDILQLIKKLGLGGDDASKFRLLAYADRGMLPPEMFEYISEKTSLLRLITYALSNNIQDDFWENQLCNINIGRKEIHHE